MTKYIFVTGGVVSSLGKGLAAASIGALLEVGFDIGVEAAAGMALAACVGAAIPGGLLCALGRRRSGAYSRIIPR